MTKNNTNTNTNTNTTNAIATTNTNGMSRLNESFTPTAITVGEGKNAITVKAGESLLNNDMGYIKKTGDEKLDKAIDALNKDSQTISMSKIHAGYILESLARDEVYKGKFKTIEEFYTYCSLAKATANRWRAVARYLTKRIETETKTGKTKVDYKLVRTDKMLESVIFAAYAVMNDKKVHLISAELLETLCETNVIRTASELYKAYNAYVDALETDDKPKKLDSNGKPIDSDSDSDSDSAVDTTADAITDGKENKKRFEVHGDSKVKSVYIPENALENTKTLYKYVLENGYDIGKTLGLDVDKENDIIYAQATAGTMLIMTAIQHTPTVKAVIFYRDTANNHGKGVKAKTETK